MTVCDILEILSLVGHIFVSILFLVACSGSWCQIYIHIG